MLLRALMSIDERLLNQANAGQKWNHWCITINSFYKYETSGMQPVFEELTDSIWWLLLQKPRLLSVEPVSSGDIIIQIIHCIPVQQRLALQWTFSNASSWHQRLQDVASNVSETSHSIESCGLVGFINKKKLLQMRADCSWAWNQPFLLPHPLHRHCHTPLATSLTHLRVQQTTKKSTKMSGKMRLWDKSLNIVIVGTGCLRWFVHHFVACLHDEVLGWHVFSVKECLFSWVGDWTCSPQLALISCQATLNTSYKLQTPPSSPFAVAQWPVKLVSPQLCSLDHWDWAWG